MMEIDQEESTQKSTETKNRTQTNIQQNRTQPKTNIKLSPKYKPSQETVTNKKLIEENDDEVMTIPKLAKGHSEVTPGEDDWFTIEKGKAVKNKNDTKK